MSVKPGVHLGDRYQLLSPIATGGMGQVWRAEDTTLHRIVAAKILRSEFTGDETFIARFRTEAQNTAALSHPNIASIYDYGETVHESERLAYLIMELVEGEPLVETLIRERRLSPDRTLDILEQTAMGLGAAHRAGMVHRDVKPGNLIIRPDGVLKITDFGIARAANSVALTERGTVVGTAQYLAPEQAEGKPAMPTSDIYALGVVGYECLAGVRPFDGDNSVAIALSQIRDTPRPLPPDVPPHVRALIQMTMAKNPSMRYRDGTAYVPVVRQVRAGGATTPPMAPTGASSGTFPAARGPLSSGTLSRPVVPLGPGGPPRGPGGYAVPGGPGRLGGAGGPGGPGGPGGLGGPGGPGGLGGPGGPGGHSGLGGPVLGGPGGPVLGGPGQAAAPISSQTFAGGVPIVPSAPWDPSVGQRDRAKIAIIVGIGVLVLIVLVVAIVLAVNSSSDPSSLNQLTHSELLLHDASTAEGQTITS